MVKDNDTAAGLSRRELLKRSAVAGTVVWATPMVLASAAGASSHCPSGSCAVYRAVKLNTEDREIPDDVCSVFEDVVKPNGTIGGFTCTGTEGYTPPSGTLVNTTCGEFLDHASITRDVDGFDVITLNAGYQFVYAISKKDDCLDSIQAGGCSTAKLRNISSHIELIYCGTS